MELIDRYPLEHKKLKTNLTLHTGDIANHSTYSNDFLPWSKEDQEMYRAKLHVPDYMLEKVREDEYGPDSRHKVPVGYYNYYCPPHCVGVSNEETKENCLMDYKDKFNIGSPSQFRRSIPDTPREPSEKFSNYRLDYRGGQLSPRQHKRNGLKVETIPCPMATETSYQSAFPYPPDNLFSKSLYESKPAKDRSSLKVGDGPMQIESTSMHDYKDPDVSAHKPERPLRDVYTPPHCSMETTTTTGRAFPSWKFLPNQVKPRKYMETD